MLEAGQTQLSEYYTSGVIANMLADRRPFQAIVLDKREFHVLGTPEQVRAFCETYPEQPPRRWCWDLDNTLVTHPVVPGDYSTCEPIPRTIAIVRDLYERGHRIIIHTARRMRTHKGNVPGVVADIGQITIESLQKHGIPYHELSFGKPYAQFYVDDLCVDPMHDIWKASGYYPGAPKPLAAAREAPAREGRSTAVVGGVAAAVGFVAGMILAKK